MSMDRPVKPNLGSTPEEIEEYVKWLDSVGGLDSEKTLLDYFAGQTLTGIHANRDSVIYEKAAMEAYMQADAMIKERNK